MKIEKGIIVYNYYINNNERATVTIYPKNDMFRTVIVEFGSTMMTYTNVQKHPSQALALRYLKQSIDD